MATGFTDNVSPRMQHRRYPYVDNAVPPINATMHGRQSLKIVCRPKIMILFRILCHVLSGNLIFDQNSHV